MVKAVIFDLWGTLVENGVNPSPSKQVKYFLRVNAQFPEFITTFEETFMTKEYDSLKDAFNEVVTAFNVNIPDFVFDKLIGMWNKNAILSKMYEDVDETLKKLKEKGYKIILLSNSDKFNFEQIVQKFELDKKMDALYASYKTGLLKSNKDAYLNILKEHKLKKEDVLVVGDCIESDIKGAENAGLKAILIDRRDSREYEQKINSLPELFEKLD